MDDNEKREYNDLMRDLTNGNTEALNSAKDNMEFSSGLFSLNGCFKLVNIEYKLAYISQN